MRSALERVRLVLDLLRTYGFARLRRRLRNQIRSETRSCGLRRDLRQPFDPPYSRVAITTRPLEDSDLPVLLPDPPAQTHSSHEVDQRRHRFRMLAAGLPGCYVAVTSNGKPCFMQWVLTADDRGRVRRSLGPVFPQFDHDTVLLEGAYTPPNLRRLGVMPTAMALVAERGLEYGARWAITFIGEENQASIEGARRAGFDHYVVRVERWRWFRRSVTFEPEPA